MTAFTWLGSFDVANRWKPFAEAQLNQMKRLGLPLKRTYFVDNAEISIQLNPPLIHIKAVSNLLFTIDGFNFVNIYDIAFFNEEIVICGRMRDQPGNNDTPGPTTSIRWSGFVVILDQNLNVRNSVLVDGIVPDLQTSFDWQLAHINAVTTDDDFIYAVGEALDLNGGTAVIVKFDKDLKVISKTRAESLITGTALEVASNDTHLFVVTRGTIEKFSKSLSFVSGKIIYTIPNLKSINAIEINNGLIYILVNDQDNFFDTRIVIFDDNLVYQKSVLIQGLNCTSFSVTDAVYISGSSKTFDGRDHGSIVKLDLSLNNIINDVIFIGAYDSRFLAIREFKGSVFATGNESIKIDPGNQSTQEEMNQGFEEAHDGWIILCDSDLNVKSSRLVNDPKDGTLSDLVIDNNFAFVNGAARLGLDFEGGKDSISTDGIISRWDNNIDGAGKIAGISDINIEFSEQAPSNVSYGLSADTIFAEVDITPNYVASGAIISDWDTIKLTGGAF